MWRRLSRQAFVTSSRSTEYGHRAKKKKKSPRSPRPILEPWSLRSTVLICLHTDRSYYSSSPQERQQRCYLQAIRPPPRLTDLRQLSFLVHRGAPACRLAVINGRQFQGSLPWRSAGAVRRRSVTDCRVINCRDGEQVISMRRCFPPDRSIQGPDLVTVVIIASPSELLDSAGARLRRSAARTRFLFQTFFYLKTPFYKWVWPFCWWVTYWLYSAVTAYLLLTDHCNLFLMDYFRFLVIVFIYTLTMFQTVILNKVNTSIHTFSKSSQTILCKLDGWTNR